jgi:hypothetical protein
MKTNPSSYNTLESNIRDRYSVGAVDFNWSSQYYEPADGL